MVNCSSLAMLLMAHLFATAGMLVAQPGPQAAPAAATEDHVIAKYLAEVRQYKPGNLLELDIGDKRGKSYDLTDKDKKFEIPPSTAKGDKVNVVEYKDADGTDVVSVRPRH